MCWANADTSLGQSNLFSCHSGSTCCNDQECSTPIPCDQCPQPVFQGESRYACNTLTQQCQCAVPQLQYTPCSNNGQCGVSSQCLLGSFGQSVSYGTIPCQNCPNANVYCMIQPTGLPGSCSCYTDTTMQQALCTDTSGTATVTDANKICGYSESASRASVVWQFYLTALAMVPCSQVNQAICSTVWTSDTTSIRMAVAVPPIRVSSSFASGGSRRRLFSTDDNEERPAEHRFKASIIPDSELKHMLYQPGWKHASQRCRALVSAYHASEDGLPGILEGLELRECAYWRYVGRKVVDEFNLTALDDMFLLSIQVLPMHRLLLT